MKKNIFIISFIFLFMLSFISFEACKKKETSSPQNKKDNVDIVSNAPLKGKIILFILPSENFRDEEYFTTREILEEAGVSITVASTTKTTVTGMLGKKVTPNMFISDCKSTDFDGIVYIGGIGAKEYWDNKTAQDLARNFYSQKKLVSAICLAPVTLARSGILKGKTATVWPDYKSEIIKNGGIYSEFGVISDENIITAEGPDYVVEFGEKILEFLIKPSAPL